MKVMNLQPGRHHEYQCVLRRVARGCVPLDGHAFQGTNDVSKIKRISFLTLDFQICFFLIYLLEEMSRGGSSRQFSLPLIDEGVTPDSPATECKFLTWAQTGKLSL